MNYGNSSGDALAIIDRAPRLSGLTQQLLAAGPDSAIQRMGNQP